MRAPTEMPKPRRSTSARIAVVVVLTALVFLAFSLRGIAAFYTDYLWFGELHLTSVWREVLTVKIVLGVVFTAAFFVIMWANLVVADLLAPKFRPAGEEDDLVDRYNQVVGPRAGLVRLGLAGAFALVAGPGASAQWNSWILFRNSTPFGLSDQLFDKDLGFFVFELPFLKFVVDWLFASFVVVLFITVAAHYLNGGIRFQAPLQKATPQVKAHLSVLLGVLALLKAADYFLERYELVYSTRGVVDGAGYTDVQARLPALQLLFLISLFACALFLVNILRRGWVLPVIAVGLWALVSAVVGTAIPTFIQQFRVQPTESTKEIPYIERNIAATLAAYNLADVVPRDFSASTDLTGADLFDNAPTVQNVRLWDPQVLARTYKRLQELRNFFEINDVDVDRYLDKSAVLTQTLLSVRELNIDGIPSQSWVNQHLVYTHGYGAVLAPSNGVSVDGNPRLLVKDLPPEGEPRITQPAVYFGENLGGYAIVNTRQDEIDYTQVDGSTRASRYEGTGGVVIDSWIRRAALALRFGELNPLISDFVTEESRAIYVRDIDDRVRKAAPFLRFDSDPYPVILRDGAIYWVYDAYTTTSRYPYAQRADTSRVGRGSDLDSRFNYVRNSVKVLIDAYNGSMTFYVVDDTDPIVRAYRKAFPAMFLGREDMDPEITEHLRYPEDIFRIQTSMYGLYHIGEPGEFYNRTDAWDIAQEPGPVGGAAPITILGSDGRSISTREQRMDPYHLLMKIPGAPKENFLLLQPFVPFSVDDSIKTLSAFMVAKSDPEEYGKIEVFVVPRDRQIDGPALVNSRINQDTDVSQEITLLGQVGSTVTLGNMLLVPINQSLLWIRPLYVEAAGSTPLPQLKQVIVVYADNVVMRPSLREALVELFGSSPPTLELQVGASTGPTTPRPGTTTPGNLTLDTLIAQANAHFAAAEEALRAGNLSTYQSEVNLARDSIRQAAELSASASTTTTTRVAA